MRAFRHPLAALLAEFVILAVPLHLAYGYAAHWCYRLDIVWGLLFALVAGIVACNGYHVYARLIAARSAPELAPRRWLDFARGAVLGAALIGVILGVIAMAGRADASLGGAPTLAGLPGVALLAGVFEELIARGVVLRNLENVVGSEVALVFTAILFGLMHAGNPNATLLSTLAVGVEGGLMLGAVFVATRSLWWTMGLHAAWNFTETTVFGIADSGNGGQGLLQVNLQGPDWLTGGAFGIEASWIGILVSLATSAMFLRWAYRRQQMRAAFWC